MGGLGSGMAYSAEDVERMAGDGLSASPTANVLIEESIYGWKEFELELMRLLDRELRPDGRAHRGLGHRGPGDDADRP
jgi:carbamoyl-phosphate synthase large subunit